MFNKKIIIVTPWFERFAGGAERLARGMAREFNQRGVAAMVFTTCSRSPYDSWWEDHYEPGVYDVAGIETRRFATGKLRARYDAVIGKLQHGAHLTPRDEQDFFACGINSDALIEALAEYVEREYEIIALPYFHGLAHSAINTYPGKISLIPCFHDEPQFYWQATERLLHNARHIFFNSIEEKEMTIRNYGLRVGRKIVESVVAGVGVELPRVEEEHNFKEQLQGAYFVYAGRKEKGKNVHLLCEWFEYYVKEFHAQSKLVFIGGGDESLVPRTESFLDLGFVSEEIKQALIRNSRGVINLSANESFSIVIMEGWLLGVPAVVSAHCAVTKGHVRRCNGGLFPENRDEFARSLKYLEEHPWVSKALAANGQRYAARAFSFDAVLAKYLRQLYEPQQLIPASNEPHA